MYLTGGRINVVHEYMYPYVCYEKKQKKLLVPIGENELKLKDVVKKKTKTGGLMYEVKLWKPPGDLPYKHISCYHIIGSRGSGVWYSSFTTNQSERTMIELKKKKGSWFKALISHKLEYFVKDGQRLKHERGRKYGEDIIVRKPEILRVCSMDDDIGYYDYFDLIK